MPNWLELSQLQSAARSCTPTNTFLWRGRLSCTHRCRKVLIEYLGLKCLCPQHLLLWSDSKARCRLHLLVIQSSIWVDKQLKNQTSITLLFRRLLLLHRHQFQLPHHRLAQPLLALHSLVVHQNHLWPSLRRQRELQRSRWAVPVNCKNSVNARPKWIKVLELQVLWNLLLRLKSEEHNQLHSAQDHSQKLWHQSFSISSKN